MEETIRYLTREEIMQEAYQLGYKYEKIYRGCAQATLLAIMEFYDIDEVLFKGLSSLSGGVAGGSQGSCGSLLGCSVAISSFFGRDISNIQQRTVCFKDRSLVNELREKYRCKYGGETCKEVQRSVFGRSYNLLDETERALFEKAGAHDDKCTSVVGNAAKWSVEILLNERIPLKQNIILNCCGTR